MKKNLLIASLAAVALLASCGGGSGSAASKTQRLQGAYDDAVSSYGDKAKWCLMWTSDAKDALRGDTNPLDASTNTDATYFPIIKGVNSYLGLNSGIETEMMQTRAIDGRVSETSNGYSVSWTYSQSRGLEVVWKWRSKERSLQAGCRNETIRWLAAKGQSSPITPQWDPRRRSSVQVLFVSPRWSIPTTFRRLGSRSSIQN